MSTSDILKKVSNISIYLLTCSVGRVRQVLPMLIVPKLFGASEALPKIRLPWEESSKYPFKAPGTYSILSREIFLSEAPLWIAGVLLKSDDTTVRQGIAQAFRPL